MGTNKRNIIEITNKGVNNFIILLFSEIEIPINKHKEIKTKIKCFLKKKNVSFCSFSATRDEVDEKEKNKPSKKRNINKNKISLSIFLHHFATTPVFSLSKLNIR